MTTYEFTLSGDQIGRFTSISGDGNGLERVVTLQSVSALGTSNEFFTIRVEQVSDGQTQFANGQFITILDSAGKIVMPRTGVQPDAEQGLAGGDAHLIISGTNFLIDVSGLNPGPEKIGYAFSDEAGDASVGDNDGQLDFANLQPNFPCFARGTLIMTPEGARAVESLRDGDGILTRDAGVQPIVWIRSRKVICQTGSRQPPPIMIPANAIGLGQPHQRLVVSPQHCVQVAFDDDTQHLVPAKALVGTNGIRAMRGCRAVEYFSILLKSHNLIWANGCLCESTYPGDFVMKTMPRNLADEVFALFPLLRFGAELGYGARISEPMTVKVAMGRLAHKVTGQMSMHRVKVSVAAR